MFTLQALVILLAAAVVAAIAGALTLAGGGSWPAALLTAGSAGAGALVAVPRLLADSPEDE